MADQDNIIDSEEWRDVPGWEGLYQASSLGRIKRLSRWAKTKGQTLAYHRARIVGGVPNRCTGYIEIALSRSGEVTKVSAHKLVCLTFHGPQPTSEHQVAHKDGTKTNNLPSNLRWATAKENAEDRELHGTDPKGSRAGNSRLTGEDVLRIRAKYRKRYGALTDLGREYGVTNACIWNIVHRKQWTHI